MTLGECMPMAASNKDLIVKIKDYIDRFIVDNSYRSQYYIYSMLLDEYQDITKNFMVHIGTNSKNLPGSISISDVSQNVLWHICINRNATSFVLISNKLAKSILAQLGTIEDRQWIGGYEYKKFLESAAFPEDIFLFHTLNFKEDK